MDESMRPSYEEQTARLYEAVGRFAVEFEHVCYALRCIVMTILDGQGLRNSNVMNILLAEQTAEPLRALTLSLLVETQSLSTQDKKIIGSLLTGVQLLTQERNDVLHSTWFIGWYGTLDGDFTNAPGIKPKRNKKGNASLDRTWKHEQFDQLTERATSITDLLRRLNACLSGGFKLENNFVLHRDGSISSRPQPYG